MEKMIGAICGDILGSTYEFGSKDKEIYLIHDEDHFTDDSVLTFALAEWALEYGNVSLGNGEHKYLLAKKFYEFTEKYPDKAYGLMYVDWICKREVVAYECLDRVKLENGSHSPLFGRTEEGSLPCKQYNRSKELGLNAEYTFDTFVVGDSNKFAHAASYAVAKDPGKCYNPLFIYGNAGGGKTHLLHAIANYIAENSLQSKVLYTTSEMLTDELIETIRKCGQNLSRNIFREKYCEADVLLIDDIQFIIGNESIQEEFFHIFNHFYREGKQMVISSDRPPREMNTLQARIRVRFEWAMIADIGVPEYETRMAILRGKKNRNFGSNIKIR